VASDGQLHTAGEAVRIVFIRGTLTATESDADVPTQFMLEPNYPNPFNPSTIIAYELPEPANVALIVYNLQGREVRRLPQGIQPPGRYRLDFGARDLASGIYIYRLEAGPFQASRTMHLVK